MKRVNSYWYYSGSSSRTWRAEFLRRSFFGRIAWIESAKPGSQRRKEAGEGLVTKKKWRTNTVQVNILPKDWIQVALWSFNLSLFSNLPSYHVKYWLLQLNTTLKHFLRWCGLSQLIYSGPLGMKPVGNQLISLLPVHHLLSLIHTCCFPFLPHCSPALCPPFWSLWESCVFQRVRKGQPYCSTEGRPWDKRMLPPVLPALCQHRWCHCTRASSSRPLLFVHCSLLLTHRHAWVTQQMHHSCLCSHTHIQERACHYCRTPTAWQPTHKDKSRHPAAKSPPFPHTSHYRGLFLAWTQTNGGCLVERKPCVLGRELICRIGVTQRVERGSQKSFKMKN